ncbi:MAG: hypothetical protein HN742_07885 [Lentisphaerae bacterium]|nr:hypothetical protein [Lentisphaerota bacterium]MBT4822568.1 hypothetical protein [Lentisphaerota bacterium]MBT5604738.1 hypothetical protein [Lentisphaerota bacterium]MBT7058088.1 hypothetical protein [Lentisphaerota bacterium]MBT7841776.1 hypothetical protein [Lentisphaerota bacterium]
MTDSSQTDPDTGAVKAARPSGVPLTLVLVLAASAVGLVALLVVCTSLHLGIPGEWGWRRYAQIDFPWIECTAIVLGFGFACFCAHIADAARGDRRIRGIALLGLLVALAWIDVHVLLAGKIGLTENIYAILDRHTTGYLSEAARIEDGGTYFRDFHNLRSKVNGAVHHLDVHPPGNVLFSHLILRACRRFPRATQALASRLSKDAHVGLSQAKTFRYFEDLLDDDAVYRAACLVVLLFLAGMTVTRICCMAAVSRLSRRDDRLGLAGLATLAAPAPILFLGHYDVLLFTLSSLWTLVLVVGLTATEERRRLAAMCVAGLLAGVGVVITLGYGVLIAMTTVILLTHGVRHRRSWLALLAFYAGGGLIVLLCYGAGVRIIEICFACMRNNTEFYLDTSRSWRWILVNPIEFAVFFGIPWLLVLPSWYRGSSIRSLFEVDGATLFRWAAGVFLVYLLIHPYCRGEIARLSLLFTPVLFVPCIQTLVERVDDRKARICSIAIVGTILVQIVVLRLSLKLAFFHGNL